MTTHHTSAVPFTSTVATSAADSFGPARRRRLVRPVRIGVRVLAIAAAGIAAGVAVHALTVSHARPTIPVVADPNVAVVFSSTAQVAGQRAADAAVQALHDPTLGVLFQADGPARRPAEDSTAALLFGPNWPVVSAVAATLDGQAAALHLIFSAVAP